MKLGGNNTAFQNFWLRRKDKRKEEKNKKRKKGKKIHIKKYLLVSAFVLGSFKRQ